MIALALCAAPLTANESARISAAIAHARQAMALARRFASKGDNFNAEQARELATRAIAQAREIARGNA